MAVSDSKSHVHDELLGRRKVISGLGATHTLSQDDSGAVVLLDRAAGIVITLPLAKVGTVFEFMVDTSVTSNAYKVITGAATEFLVGTLASVDTDSSDAVAGFSGNGSSHVAVSMNGTTSGGLLGTRMRFTCLSATSWMVEGTNRGSGAVATPFATS